MAYGLRIINDNSELLIDSDYVNPTFVQKLEFNATPTSTETGIYSGTIDNLHAGYYKRTYTTPTATLNNGTYIVLWTLPDNGNVDVWYNFPTSVMDVNRTLTCEVYASTTGTALTYTLPTAYIFATDTGSLSTLYTDGPALRMYNSSSQKTFDSSFTQLIPYYISDEFTLSNSSSSATISVTSPTNGIHLLPKAYTIYQINATNSPGTTYQVLYDNVYKRYGSTLYSKQISSYWNNVSGSTVLQQYGSGLDGYKSILIADGDLYQGANGSSITTTNPTYTLSANYATVNETNSKTITVTLTTTNVTNGTVVYYTVTGISAADLTSGSLTGNFIIQTNTASVSFTVATDTLTEGTETFLLSLNGIGQSVSVSILDTSRSPYAWGAPSSTSVNENTTTSYIDFNSLYTDSTYPVTFDLVGSSTGGAFEIIFAYPDVTLNPTIPSGATYTRVYLTIRADMITEGPKTFRVRATVEGNSYYTSDITINDTTTSSVTAATDWTALTDNTVTINVAGGSGKTVYLYSDNTAAIDVKAGSISSWALNSNSFTTTTTYQAKSVTVDTQVGLYLKNGDEFIASKFITVKPVVASYSWATTPLSVNEGTTGSLQFNYTNAPANTVINFTLQPPASGTSATPTTDGSLTTTSFTTGTTVSSGSVSVGYSIVADNLTEGVEKFLLQAAIGTSIYKSEDITINDTSLSRTYSITTASNWAEGGLSNSIVVTANNANGLSLYLTSSEPTIAYVKTPNVTNWLIDSNTYSATTYFSAAAVTNSTNVTLYLRTGSATGPIVTQTDITITDASAQYSWAGSPLSVNEGASSSLVFNYAEAAGVSFGFSLASPTGGVADGSPEVSLNTTDFTVGGTDAAGTVTVNYSIPNDFTADGTKYFRLAAYANGTYYYSSNITVSDTSTVNPSGITVVASYWDESTLNYATNIRIVNSNGYVYYPTSSGVATCQTTNFTVSGNDFSTTIYWDTSAVTADTTVTLYLRRSRSNGTIDYQTSVLVRNILPAGTIISEGCLATGVAPYTYRQVIANGSGGSTNSDTNNSVSCGYVAPTYSLVASPTSVNEGSSFTITLTTNQSGSFPYTITGVSSADIGSTSLTGTLANGGTRTINVSSDLSVGEGTEYFVATLDNGLATTGSVTINDTSVTSLIISQTGNTYGSVNAAFSSSFTLAVNGTATAANWSVSGTIPAGLALTKTGNTSGVYYTTYTLSGTPTTVTSYTFTITASTASSGSTSLLVTVPIYAQSGTNSGTTYCGTGTNKYTLYQDKHNGAGGTYQTTVSTNSATCGYVAPSFNLSNTTTGTISNGGGFSFTHNASNADGTAVSFTVSGAGASYVTVTPSSFTVSGTSEAKVITVSTTARAGGTAAQSVTITPNTCTGFSFTLPAVPVATPTVTAIRVGGDATVYNGEQSYAIITFSSGITATTYLQVEFNLGSYAPFYNSGNPIVNTYAGNTSSANNYEFLVGATEGIVYTPTNPGNYDTQVKLRARSVDSNANPLTSYTTYAVFNYKKTGTIVV